MGIKNEKSIVMHTLSLECLTEDEAEIKPFITIYKIYLI